MTNPPLIEGTIEYLNVEVNCDVTLDAQPVAFSLDKGVTWLTATWVGDPGTTRTAQILLDGTLPPKTYHVYVKVTDTPEIPVVNAGTFGIVRMN